MTYTIFRQEDFRKKKKYRNQSCDFGGIRYDSIKEANHAQELTWRIKAKEVKEFIPHFKIDIRVNGQHVTNYFVDFKVVMADGSIQFHEVKSSICGCELVKGWHVDHKEPVERKFKRVDGGWFFKGTHNRVPNAHKLTEEEIDFKFMEYRGERMAADGFHKPQNDVIENKIPACASCNINKHGYSLEQFRELILGFMKHLNEINTQYKIAKRYGLIRETNIEVKFYFEKIEQQKVA